MGRVGLPDPAVPVALVARVPVAPIRILALRVLVVGIADLPRTRLTGVVTCHTADAAAVARRRRRTYVVRVVGTRVICAGAGWRVGCGIGGAKVGVPAIATGIAVGVAGVGAVATGIVTVCAVPTSITFGVAGVCVNSRCRGWIGSSEGAGLESYRQ